VDGELVTVDDDLRLVRVHRAVNDCGFGEVEFDVIAVDVDAVRRRPGGARRAIRVGARHDQHRDAIEKRIEVAHRETLRDREHRLAARRLVAVLQALKPDDRPIQPHGVRRGNDRRVRKHEHRDCAAFLRLAENSYARTGGTRRQVCEPGDQLVVRREIAAPGANPGV
jgi:hypothetical protein